MACGGDDTDVGRVAPSAGSNAPGAALVTPIERPPEVPASATVVEVRTMLGRLERQPGGPAIRTDTRLLEDASCENGVVVFDTSAETIYAALSCDGFWNEEMAPTFVGKDVAIRLDRTAERFIVFIETAEEAQAQFPVRGIWLE